MTTEHDLFEARLAAAVRAYATEAPAHIEASAFARAIVAANSAQSRWAPLRILPRDWSALGWVLLAAVLALASLVAVAAGSRWFAPHPARETIQSDLIPAELHGLWQAVPSGPYRLDFRTAAFVSGPEGALPEFGRIVRIDRRAEPGASFVLRVAGPCGVGTYDVVRQGDDRRLRFKLISDDCAERTAILTSGSWIIDFGDGQSDGSQPRPGAVIGEVTSGPFVAGQTYDSGIFTEPFTFVMPSVNLVSASPGDPVGFDRFARRYMSAGGLRIGDPYWAMYVLDDLPVNSDLCDEASALLADIPPTPEAVAAWLRTNRGWIVSDGKAVTVDGRSALRFTIRGTEVSDCRGGALVPGGLYVWVAVAYAVPTGDDTILVTGGGYDGEAVTEVVDAFVRSMDFQ